MTKASSARRAKRRHTKARTEYVYATTSGVVSEISVTYDPVKDEIRFETPVENTYFESSYERPKGPKVINRIPLRGPGLQFRSSDALLRNFDVFVAADTNTKVLAGRRISMTGTIVGRSVTTSDGKSAVAWDCPLWVELTEVAGPEERIGWIEALRALFAEGLITAQERIGLVVDAHFKDLPAINTRTQPVHANVFLPPTVTLVYASADVGSEHLANTLIRAADRSATMALDYLSEGRAPLNDSVVQGMPFRGRRVLFGRKQIVRGMEGVSS